jgi:hypothetical protein
MKKRVLLIALLLLLFISALIVFKILARNESVSDYQRCVNNGGIILKSFPAQCKNENGETFIEGMR